MSLSARQIGLKLPSSIQADLTESDVKEERVNPFYASIDSALIQSRLKKEAAIKKVDADFALYEKNLYAYTKEILSHFKQAESMLLTNYLLEWLTPTLDKLTNDYFQYRYANQGLGNGDVSVLFNQFMKAVAAYDIIKQKLIEIAKEYEDDIKYVSDELKERFQPLEVPPKMKQVLRNYYFYVLRAEFERRGIVKGKRDLKAECDKLADELLSLRHHTYHIYIASQKHINALLEEWRIDKDALSEEMKPVLSEYQRCFQNVHLAKLNYLEISVEQAERNLATIHAALEKYKPVSPTIEIDISSIDDSEEEVKSVAEAEDFVTPDAVPRTATASPKPLTDKSKSGSAKLRVLRPTPASALSNKPRWNSSTKIDGTPLLGCSFLKAKYISQKAKENIQAKNVL